MNQKSGTEERRERERERERSRMISSTILSLRLLLVCLVVVLHVEEDYLVVANTDVGTSSSDVDDHLALLAIKANIIPNEQGGLATWNDSSHFCNWEGITCGKRHKRVTVLNISSRGLVGTLSPYVGNLSFLRELWLHNNTFKGEIPPQVGRLFRLQRLAIMNNSFEGEIPANLSQCSELTHLVLGNNELVGKIPIELGSLLLLKRFVIQKNKFTGILPPFIGNFTSLEVLSATFNLLTGRIPETLGRLKSLNFLALGVNGFSGMIPSSIFNLSSLTDLSMPENQLRGSLPADLGLMLPRLYGLQLRDNQFTGLIPASISNCSELETLGMERNNFNGKVDIHFGGMQNLWLVTLFSNNFGSGEGDEMNFVRSMTNCSDLHVLDLHDNQFRGMLPESVANLSTQLFYLTFGANYIYGRLPSTIGNLVGLTAFSVELNQISGMIPNSIGNLRKLQVLALLGNGFYGEIPASVGNLTLLNELHLENNRLEGSIPFSLGDCQNLLSLMLQRNNLSGSIPKQIFGISSLSISLNLARNHLSGTLPLEICNLKNLAELDVSDNDLSSEIPSSLSSCTSLETLSLRGNFFQGVIPHLLSSLRGIQHLDLSRNNLSGQIPPYLQEFALKYLNLSFNDFEGEVPMKGVFANITAVSVVGNNRLCGGVPELQLPKCTMEKIEKSKRHQILALKIGTSLVCSLLVVAVLSFFLFCWCQMRRKVQVSGPVMQESFLQVSYERLLRATEGFSAENLIGVGGFGSVYKGNLDEFGAVVAVKVLNLQHQGAFKSFTAECETLRNIRHRNLVKIITSCSSVDFQGNDFKALVYGFMPNGSLEKWLHSNSKIQNGEDELQKLSLHQRINILNDVAAALDYLHNHCQTPIVHCDLKPSNILLDHNMTAHIGDFGLAKILSGLEASNRSSSIGVRGTIGYAPPEYGIGNEVSTNGDIYSFGIIVLEMITGKSPIDPMFQEGPNLHGFARSMIPDHVMEIVEPLLLDNDEEKVATTAAYGGRAKTYNGKEECLISMVKIGVACSMESPLHRMSISSVINELQRVRVALQGTQTGS